MMQGISILLVILFIPLLMCIIGKIFEIKPPKNINGICGYRTKRSRKNIESWNYAQKRIGELFIRFGIALIIISLLLSPFILKVTDRIIIKNVILAAVYGIELPGLFIAMFIVEKELKEKF